MTVNTSRSLNLQQDPHGHGNGIVDPRVIKYAGLSLIFGFALMLVLDQGFLIVQERAKIKEHTQIKKLADANEHTYRAGINESSFKDEKKSSGSLEKIIAANGNNFHERETQQ